MLNLATAARSTDARSRETLSATFDRCKMNVMSLLVVVNMFVQFAGTLSVIEFHYLHEDIKNILNSLNACYYTLPNLLSSRLFSKQLKIKMQHNFTYCFVWA
jgi:hypothetical protein